MRDVYQLDSMHFCHNKLRRGSGLYSFYDVVHLSKRGDTKRLNRNKNSKLGY